MKKRIIRHLTVIVVSLLFLGLFYGSVLLSPNSYLFSSLGDGIKNYYTYAYFIKNNVSYTNFEGFNYPYGESVLYTDGHPLLAWVLKSFAEFSTFPLNYCIGILNSLLLLSFVVGSYFLYRLLLELKVHALLATVCAVAIMALSPQLFRLEGHLALAYSCCIPITLYLLLRQINSKKKQYLFLLIANAVFWFFTHAYLGMISIAILFCYFLVDTVWSFSRKGRSAFRFDILICSLFPTILFVGIAKIIDQHGSRTTNPYGFFEYYAHIDTVFLPNTGYFNQLLTSLLPPFTQTWEGWAYIGLANILLLPFIAMFFIKKDITRSNNHFFVKKLLLSSFLLLLFSFGFPFRYGMEGLLEYVSLLKQFRSIGRFAWVFYFVISIASVYLIQLTLLKYNRKKRAVSLLFLFPVLMVIESIPYHRKVSESITISKNIFNTHFLTNGQKALISELDESNYQAIIPLPYYHIGSENYEKEGNQEAYFYSMFISYHLGLPLTGAYLSRPSMEESRNAMQLFSPSFYDKWLKDDIEKSEDFLLLQSGENLSSYENQLVKKGKSLHAAESISLYSIATDVLFKNTTENIIQQFHRQKPSLYFNNSFYLSDTTGYVFEEFENSGASIAFRGKSSREIDKQEENFLARIESSFFATEKIHASIWLSRLSDNFGQDDLNHLQFSIQEKEGNDIVKRKNYPVMSSPVIDKGWTLFETDYVMQNKNNALEFYLIGNSPRAKKIYADDLLIRVDGLNLYRSIKMEDTTIYFFNNHKIKMIK